MADSTALGGMQVKIAEEVYVIRKRVNVAGGLICASVVSKHGRLSDVHLSGAFFFYPAPRLAELERALEGDEAWPEAAVAMIQPFYAQHNVETPGVKPDDFAGVLSMAWRAPVLQAEERRCEKILR